MHIPSSHHFVPCEKSRLKEEVMTALCGAVVMPRSLRICAPATMTSNTPKGQRWKSLLVASSRHWCLPYLPIAGQRCCRAQQKIGTLRQRPLRWFADWWMWNSWSWSWGPVDAVISMQLWIHLGIDQTDYTNLCHVVEWTSVTVFSFTGAEGFDP